jgi:hypothetical protein
MIETETTALRNMSPVLGTFLEGKKTKA